MWFNKNKGIITTGTVELLPETPTTRNIVVELVLVNNFTDKEYTYTSINDFGLDWKYVNEGRVLRINQNNNIDETEWFSLGQFTNFSITKITFKTIEIK
jgi:hypothetical protein